MSALDDLTPSWYVPFPSHWDELAALDVKIACLSLRLDLLPRYEAPEERSRLALLISQARQYRARLATAVHARTFRFR